MLYIDNLCEFVKQVILNNVPGVVFPQNAEYADTCEIIRYYAKKYHHKIWITKLLNPFVWITGSLIRPVGKMFSDSTYDMKMSEYSFEYQVVGLEESFENVEPKNGMR